MISSERRGPVTIVTIDRPERRNALNADMCRLMSEAVEGAVDAEARVVVVTGSGGTFCAGADLSGVEDEHFRDALRRLLEALTEAPVVTMAAVEGAALGAGTQLAVACDLRVATADARFGIPAAKLGLVVDHWTVQRVVALAGQGPARAMLLAAEEVDGTTALALGLAQRQGALPEALAWADDIAGLAPLTIAGHKLALNRLEAPVGGDDEVEEARRRAWASEDLVEGMAAFRERRPPHFRGR